MNCEHCGAALQSVVCDYCDCRSEDFAKAFPEQPAPEIQQQELRQSIESLKNEISQSVVAGVREQVKSKLPGASTVPDKPKRRIITIILLIFLGMFGIHKFYEGKIISGVAYAVATSLFGVFGLGWLVWIALVVDFVVLVKKPKIYYIKKQ
jgi:TM2 domain-containing membrane protein YozV